MDRTAVAEALLREAVQRSRLERAAPFVPGGGASGAISDAGSAGSPPTIGQCGLGERPSSAPEIDDRARVLLAQLWPDGVNDDLARRVRKVCDQWVVEQDDLDRKRNHFLKDFRKHHGFARTAYSPEQLADYEAALARINAEEDRARSIAAEALLAANAAHDSDASKRRA